MLKVKFIYLLSNSMDRLKLIWKFALSIIDKKGGVFMSSCLLQLFSSVTKYNLQDESGSTESSGWTPLVVTTVGSPLSAASVRAKGKTITT